MNGSPECLQYILDEVYGEFPYELNNEKGYNILHSAVEGKKNENFDMIMNRLNSDDKTSQDTEKLILFLNSKSNSGIYDAYISYTHTRCYDIYFNNQL